MCPIVYNQRLRKDAKREAEMWRLSLEKHTPAQRDYDLVMQLDNGPIAINVGRNRAYTKYLIKTMPWKGYEFRAHPHAQFDPSDVIEETFDEIERQFDDNYDSHFFSWLQVYDDADKYASEDAKHTKNKFRREILLRIELGEYVPSLSRDICIWVQGNEKRTGYSVPSKKMVRRFINTRAALGLYGKKFVDSKQWPKLVKAATWIIYG
jgi:hypothetical protein